MTNHAVMMQLDSTDSSSDDHDVSLWAELNHQQSREIELHMEGRRRQDLDRDGARRLLLSSRTNLYRLSSALRGGVTHTASKLSDIVSIVSGQAQTHTHTQAQGHGQGQAQYLYHESLREEPLLSSPEVPDYNNSNTHNQQQQQQQQQKQQQHADGWGAVADLDVFFTSLYQYYYHRGYATICLKAVVELFTLFFTLALSIFLFAYVDWALLASCTEESTCQASFSSYIRDHPFKLIKASSNDQRQPYSWIWKGWICSYGLIFFCYGLFSTWSWYQTLQRAQASKWFMEEQLGVSERKLQSGAVDWDADIVTKIQTLQSTGRYRIVIPSNTINKNSDGHHYDDHYGLSALHVAQRIMRKENYMIALFNDPSLLDWSVPLAPGMVFFSKSLEWTIYFCILNFMFNHNHRLRPAFYLDPVALKRRLFLCGVAHVVFMPFLLFFMTLYFSLKNAYDWKNTKQFLGDREWSAAAKWTFREFNELPHLFERRMEPSYDAAETYLQLFRQNEMITAIGRILVFIGGSLGAVLLAFAAVNDAILLHVKIANWNLLWYAGVVAAIYSTGKSVLPSQERGNNRQRTYHANLAQEMDLALERVASHTHHYPDQWKGRGWDKTTYKSFMEMYKYKAQLFVRELLSITAAPYILCVSLPSCAESICNFVLATKAEVIGVGDVCGYSTFDFEAFGDKIWEGHSNERREDHGEESPRQLTPPFVVNPGPQTTTNGPSESILYSSNVFESTQQFLKPKAKDGKMEKSFFSFKIAHPSWKCSSSGQDLFNALDKYQQEENAAMVRERQLHIQTAARQLELMAQLEQHIPGSAGRSGLVVDSKTMEDSYIRAVNATTQHTPADAGAGAGKSGQSFSIGTPPRAISSEFPFMPNTPTRHPEIGSVLAASTMPRPISAETINLARSLMSLPFEVEEERDHAAENRYRLLERYHSHNRRLSLAFTER